MGLKQGAPEMKAGGGGGEAGKKWDYFLVCFLQPIVQDGCNVINWCV